MLQQFIRLLDGSQQCSHFGWVRSTSCRLEISEIGIPPLLVHKELWSSGCIAIHSHYSPTVVTLYGQGMLVILDILQNILASWFLHSVRLTFTTHLFNTVFDVVLKLAQHYSHATSKTHLLHDLITRPNNMYICKQCNIKISLFTMCKRHTRFWTWAIDILQTLSIVTLYVKSLFTLPWNFLNHLTVYNIIACKKLKWSYMVLEEIS